MDGVRRNAVLSEDGVYRWVLSRDWGNGRPRCAWIMLNPSTADHRVDDPTIRRCETFSRDWGFAGMDVVNLFAYRATKPTELAVALDPVGDECDDWIRQVTATAGLIVCAWGQSGGALATQRVRDLFTLPDGVLGDREELSCLGVTRTGAPRHPLYLARTTPTRNFQPNLG